MSIERKITWRAFGDDRLEGAAFGWTRYSGSYGDLHEAPLGTRNDARRDPLGDGPYRVTLCRLYGGQAKQWMGEFHVGGMTFRYQYPAEVGIDGDSYGRGRREAKRRLEEKFWCAYDDWHAPAAKAAREAAAQAEADAAAVAKAENEARLRVQAAGPVLAHALKAIVERWCDKERPPVDDDLWVLAETALREAGVTLETKS